MTNQERINSYLNGTMSPKEEKDFMNDCCEHNSLMTQLCLEGIFRVTK